MRKFKNSLLVLSFFVAMFTPIFCLSNDIDVSFQGDNLSDYYVVAGDGFHGNVPYNLFSGRFIADEGLTIESISGFISISVDGQPNAETRLSFLSEGIGCTVGLRHDNNTLTLDNEGHADILINLSEQRFNGCMINPGNTYWNIILAKSTDVDLDTVVDGISLNIDSITYRDENDQLKTVNIGNTVQGSSIHFVEKDPYAPKLIFNQPSNYVQNKTINLGTGVSFDVLGTDGYEVPIIYSKIELLNTDSIVTYSLSGKTTIYIDNAIADKMVNSAFYFKVTFGSCNFVTNRGETKKLDENGHAELNVGLSKSSCTISQEYNTFKITAIARGAVKSGTTITIHGFNMGDITYHELYGYGTIEIDEVIPGTNLYFIKENQGGNNTSNIENNGIIDNGESTDNNMKDTSTPTEKPQDKPNNKETTVDNIFNYSMFNPNYSEEMNKAYQYAYKYGITTINKIEKANMMGGLTRVAMAKMLSNYAINVLGKDLDTNKRCYFEDVSSSLDYQYNNGVTRACQLGIMGVGMRKFRPYDSVTRAEFGTALSRLLFDTADGQGAYYEPHLRKLMQEKIITVNNPKIEEKRGYVMLMLMRSAD